MELALRDSSAHLEWTIQPMLAHLRPRLGQSDFIFLQTLASALSYSGAMADLDEFPQWRGETITNELAT
jgi:hypothetical protein